MASTGSSRKIFCTTIFNNKIINSAITRWMICKMITRFSSSGVQQDMVHTNYSQCGKIATVELNRPPANSFSMQFMEDIIRTLETIENNNECRGIIFTSSIANIFCAGLDLNEVLYSSKSRLVIFRKRFQEMWSLLYGTRLVTMAAIKGHAIAGGCVLSLTCDVSIMAQGYKIGLPELSLGLYLSPWMSGTLISAVGRNKAEKIIYTAQVMSSEQAADIGLIHKVVPLKSVLPEVHKEMSKWLSIPDESRRLTKAHHRKELLDLLHKTKEEDMDMFISRVTDEDTRKQIARRLKKHM